MQVLYENILLLQWQQVVMWIIGGILIYLAIRKDMEPTLLLPMGFGAILVNLPMSGAVTQIHNGLEEIGVIGQAKSLNVENMSSIELWYGDRYQVLLGDTTQLKYKLQSMKKAIDQQKDYQTGILDVSFTTWPDHVNLSKFPE